MSDSKNRRQKFDRNDLGFTLVELMICVAIIGLLSAIAIPNYAASTARARQIEAKVGLTALYTAEMNYGIESGTLTGCLVGIGFTVPSGQRYYDIGFQPQPGIWSCNRDGSLLDCNCSRFGISISAADAVGAGLWDYKATVVANPGVTTPLTKTQLLKGGEMKSNWLPPGNFTKLVFRAQAIGSVSSRNSVADSWYIDESSNLVNDAPGL